MCMCVCVYVPNALNWHRIYPFMHNFNMRVWKLLKCEELKNWSESSNIGNWTLHESRHLQKRIIDAIPLCTIYTWYIALNSLLAKYSTSSRLNEKCGFWISKSLQKFLITVIIRQKMCTDTVALNKINKF